MSHSDQQDRLRDRIEQIVNEGQDVRGRVREAFEEAAVQAQGLAGQLADILKSTAEGAAKGSQGKPDTGPLKDVVDGLGDGLQRTANAARLAMEEAASKGKAYAEDDMNSFASEFATLGKLFADTVSRAASKAGEHSADVLRDLKDHAQRTAENIEPDLRRAYDAAKNDAPGAARDIAAGANDMVRENGGKLLETIGDLFKRAGESLGGSAGAPADDARRD